ncbi:MAG: hypothetical protein ACFCD0_06225 [Gemmataceae bacterium]
MDLLTSKELQALAATSGDHCVSIYLRTHQTRQQSSEDKLRFKNLLVEAEKALTEQGMRNGDLQKYLEGTRQLLKDELFWTHQDDGLAVFLSSESLKVYHLPRQFDELVVVGQRFHLTPLIPLVNGDGTFYVLSLSQNKVRFLEGTRHTIRELEVEGMPANMEEALNLDTPEKQLQYHTRAGERQGQRAAMFHGHGGAKDVEKELLSQYLRAVDKVVHGVFNSHTPPLILAGTTENVAIYRSVSKFNHISESVLSGNFDQTAPNELHQKAWNIVGSTFETPKQAALATFQQLAGGPKTSDQLVDILPAAHEGRIESLFVAATRHQWGRFDLEKLGAELHDSLQPGDEDLLDLAAVKTFQTGGDVFVVGADEMPGKNAVAAVFRY